MAVPLSNKLAWEKANPLWASSLNPVLANPLNNISVLTNISFRVGVNILDHGLGRMMNGWFVIDPQGSGTLFRSQPLNKLTLTLTSDADFVSSIGVF